MNDLETIEMTLGDEESWGIDAISFVERPAIKENFIALSAEEVQLKAVDEDKRIVMGVALVPNKKIYRNNRGFEYNIEFSEDTVLKASQKYLKNLKLHNATEEHQKGLVDGVFLTESWIVEDSQKDKSAVYGLNAPVGSWVVAMKVENDDVWSKVKDGKYLGFSIEGMFKGERRELSAVQKIEDLVNEYLKNKYE